MSVVQLEELLASKDELQPTDMVAFLAWMQELSDSVPPEAWDELPPDGAENLDEYLYHAREYKP